LDPNRISFDFLKDYAYWVSNNFLLGFEAKWLFFLIPFIASLLLSVGKRSLHSLESFQILIARVLQFFLIYFGSAANSPRYLVVVLTIVLFALTLALNYYFQNLIRHLFSVLTLGLIFIVISYTVFVYRNYSDTFFICSTSCINFSQQINDIKNGESHYIYHWPMNYFSPDWFTDIKNPQVELAPFQKTTISGL
jgi:hypothetical protein